MKKLLLITSLVAWFSASSVAALLGTSFTYQGRLQDGSNPAHGDYDLTLTLFAAASGGMAVGRPITNSPVSVSNGLFTTTLDFGAGVFTGDARWLEIGVRASGSASDFTTLVPRQPLTPAPYAVYASGADAAGLSGTIAPASIGAGTIQSNMLANGAVTANKLAPGAVNHLDALDGSPTNALMVSVDGLIGVGTNTPQAGLHVTTGSTLYQPRVLFEGRNGIGGFNYLNNAQEVAVSGNLLAISAPFANAVTLVNVSNPAAPVLQSVIVDGTGAFTNLSNPRDIVFSGNLLAVAGDTDNTVTLIDVSNPANPVRRGEMRDGVAPFQELNGATGLALRGTLLAVAAGVDDAVTLANISNSNSPALYVAIKDGQFGFNDLDGAISVSLSGNLLAVGAFNDDAVTLMDVSTPSAPVLRAVLKDGVGGFNELHGVTKVYLFGNLLVITAQLDNSVTLVDVSNPSSPVLRAVLKDGVGGFDALQYAVSAALSGNLLAVTAAGDNAITLVDISDPSSPVLKGVFRNLQGGLTSLNGPYGITFFNGNLAVAGFGSHAFTLLQPVESRTAISTPHAVGIGTTMPAAPLHVIGNFLVENARAAEIRATRVSLGIDTVASGTYSTAMGNGTIASGENSTALGCGTIASRTYSTAMGYSTAASGENSTAMGNGTTASGENSTALGYNSTASGTNSIAMGDQCSATQSYTLAAGRRAKANHSGAFVWGDSYNGDIASSSTNQFTARASGGVRFFSNTGQSAGVRLDPGTTAWGTLSDRQAKKDFVAVDSRAVLEKLAALPIERWRYHWEEADSSPHLGPMAQDFKAAFYPGRDDKIITTLELDGVALAAIQGLNKKVEEQKTSLAAKEQTISSLEKRLAELEKLVQALRPTPRRK